MHKTVLVLGFATLALFAVNLSTAAMAQRQPFPTAPTGLSNTSLLPGANPKIDTATATPMKVGPTTATSVLIGAGTGAAGSSGNPTVWIGGGTNAVNIQAAGSGQLNLGNGASLTNVAGNFNANSQLKASSYLTLHRLALGASGGGGSDIIVGITGSAVAYTLPASQSAGRIIIVKNETANTNNTVIVPGGETIDGSTATITLGAMGTATDKLRLYYVTTGWMTF